MPSQAWPKVLRIVGWLLALAAAGAAVLILVLYLASQAR